MIYLVKSKAKRRVKVHQAADTNRPVCGGGRAGKSAKEWQIEIGPANCKRCEQLIAMKATKQAEMVL